jgi:hypothetical protein
VRKLRKENRVEICVRGAELCDSILDICTDSLERVISAEMYQFIVFIHCYVLLIENT